jgi:hypothetical protein
MSDEPEEMESSRHYQQLALLVSSLEWHWRERAEQEQKRAERERERAARLEQRLRALGIDPDEVALDEEGPRHT